jgi:hypothetical protein
MWTPGIWIGYALGLLALCGMVWGALGQSAPRINVLVLISGALIGWVVGMLMTPVTGNEQAHFPEYGKALSTFVTGYLVAKLDRLFESVVGTPTNINEVLIARLLLFISSFALGTLATYIWRGGYISA